MENNHFKKEADQLRNQKSNDLNSTGYEITTRRVKLMEALVAETTVMFWKEVTEENVEIQASVYLRMLNKVKTTHLSTLFHKVMVTTERAPVPKDYFEMSKTISHQIVDESQRAYLDNELIESRKEVFCE